MKRLLALLLCLSLLLPASAFAEEEDEEDIDLDELLDVEDIDFEMDENGEMVFPDEQEEDYFDESAYSSSGNL